MLSNPKQRAHDIPGCAMQRGDELVAPAAPRKISIFGLGYVGAVSLACLARDGHEMTGVDIDPGKLELLRSGQAPIVETGIQELTRAVMRGGSVTVTDSVRDAILVDGYVVRLRRHAGAPERQPGSRPRSRASPSRSARCCRRRRRGTSSSMRSTVKPGTVEEVIKPAIEASSGLKAGRDFSLCFQPEFLREGTSINDYDNPPLTVVGADDDYARRSAARRLRPSAVRVRAHLDPHRRDAQVRLQRLSCAEGDVRERDRAHLAVGRRRSARSDEAAVHGSPAQHLLGVPAARASRSAARACRRT